MLLQELITPDSVAANVEARSKKHCLELLSELLARPEPRIASEEVFAGLVDRERLGCTSLAKGAAFPHCRMAGITSARGALLKLAAPVEFDAVDGGMVDLVFGLVVPETPGEADYRIVDRITALLEDDRLLAGLRAANDDAALYRALLAPERAAPGTRSTRHG